MKLVIIESPYSGDIEENKKYARLCMADSFSRDESPFVSHLLNTQVLDESILEDRELGIKAGLAWAAKADLTAVYTDRGISQGMRQGMMHAAEHKRPVELRQLYSKGDHQKLQLEYEKKRKEYRKNNPVIDITDTKSEE